VDVFLPGQHRLSPAGRGSHDVGHASGLVRDELRRLRTSSGVTKRVLGLYSGENAMGHTASTLPFQIPARMASLSAARRVTSSLSAT
jgi:hypothetical protein